jgi:serine/threonine protein kinase
VDVGISGPHESVTNQETTETEAASRLVAGEVVADRYRVVEFLAEGGMGAVYRVEHLHMRKSFALKVLHASLLRNPEVVARFEREAVAAGNIDHPNVAAATDFGRLQDGSFFLVLEFVRGRSLRDVIGGGALDQDRAVNIVRGIVAGVGAAHARGIVHRDLKPENIMLVDHDGDPDFVKVLDFGIAKVDLSVPVGADAGATPLTAIGSVMGTPEYMAPEQALGETVDARSDIYSLGVIFYELLAGQCPFVGSAVAVLQGHVLQPPPFPEDLVARVDSRIVDIVRKLLAKQPQDRFDSLATLAAELAEVAAPPRIIIDAPARPPAPSSADRAVDGGLRAGFDTGHRLFVQVSRLSRPLKIGALVLAVAVAAWVVVAFATSGKAVKPKVAPVQAPVPSEVAAPLPPPPVEGPSSPPDDVTPVLLPPPPAAQGSAASTPPRAGANGSGPNTSATHGTAHRRTGPGGIYIPPPKDWFK